MALLRSTFTVAVAVRTAVKTTILLISFLIARANYTCAHAGIAVSILYHLHWLNPDGTSKL